MAKKKSKSKTNAKTGNIILFVIFIFTVATLCMSLLTNVSYPAIIGDDVTITGLDVVFGWKTELLGKTIEISSFSVIGLLAYSLPVLGLITALLFNKSKFLSIIPLACFIASAVLLFLIPNFVVFGAEQVNQYVNASLGLGAIIAGALSSLNAVTLAGKIFLS